MYSKHNIITIAINLTSLQEDTREVAINLIDRLQISSQTGKVSLIIGRKQEWELFRSCKRRLLRHATQKVFIQALFHAQSSVPYGAEYTCYCNRA